MCLALNTSQAAPGASTIFRPPPTRGAARGAPRRYAVHVGPPPHKGGSQNKPPRPEVSAPREESKLYMAQAKTHT